MIEAGRAGPGGAERREPTGGNVCEVSVLLTFWEALWPKSPSSGAAAASFFCPRIYTWSRLTALTPSPRCKAHRLVCGDPRLHTRLKLTVAGFGAKRCGSLSRGLWPGFPRPY